MNYTSKPSDFVCYTHFSDKYIQKFIKENSSKEKCKYCSKVKASIEIRDLAEHIEDCINYEYNDPYSQGAPYDKEATYYENRFPGTKVSYAEDILQDELGIDDDYNIAQDLTSHFENQYLSEVNGIFGPTQDEYMSDGWDLFKEIIKHKIRFVFFNPSFSKTFVDEYGERLNPYEVLSEVGKAIIELKLFTKFKNNKLEVFRGIQHDSGVTHQTAKLLGSPPTNLAKANRMSPAGISMFYGAFEKETAIKEIIDETSAKHKLTIGKFSNLKEINLIDFTKLKQIPSLFNLKERDKRYISKFILSFIRDISVPVKPDNSVHIDYIPTQVVTEYLKFIMPKKFRVDGIIYNSVKNPEGKCVVLFFENTDMTDNTSNPDASLLLIKNSLKTIDILTL